MTEFTKGPWVMDKRDECLIGKFGYEVVVYNHGLTGGHKTDERVANAHLIAEAPDMYTMLNNINESINDCKNEIELANKITSMCHDIDQLLKRARGE
ncbi:MAG: hypothetical protein COA43_14550 [Robiginitomaculum sp.]|nr:MAG: hypothetical protein COA43_14550 [Robiginitomaculum sp.]